MQKPIEFAANCIHAVHPEWEKVMLRSMVGAALLAVAGTAFAAEPSLSKQGVQWQALTAPGQRADAGEVDRTALRAATAADGLRIDFSGGHSVFATTLRLETMPDDKLVWGGTVWLPGEDRNVETRNGVTRLAIRDSHFDA